MQLSKPLKIQEKSPAPTAPAAAKDGQPGAMETPAFAIGLQQGSSRQEASGGGNVDKCGHMRTFTDISVGICHNAGKRRGAVKPRQGNNKRTTGRRARETILLETGTLTLTTNDDIRGLFSDKNRSNSSG